MTPHLFVSNICQGDGGFPPNPSDLTSTLFCLFAFFPQAKVITFLLTSSRFLAILGLDFFCIPRILSVLYGSSDSFICLYQTFFLHTQHNTHTHTHTHTHTYPYKMMGNAICRTSKPRNIVSLFPSTKNLFV